MADLVIVIPFAANKQCDLDQTATEMKTFFDSITNHELGSHVDAEIAKLRIVNKDDSVKCKGGDYVILFAHGAKESTKLYDNLGGSISMGDTIEKLAALDAHKAERVFFMCCYSAREGHIGCEWKAGHEDQTTFGGEKDIAKLWSATRKQIYNVCVALHEI